MRVRPYRLLLVVVVSLSAAAAIACFAYRSAAAFSGALAVSSGRKESVAVIPATVVVSSKTINLFRNVPAKNIAFQDKEAAFQIFSKRADYHAVRLPFSVKLEKIEVVSAPSPEHFLKLSGPCPEQTIGIKDGSEILVAGVPFTVKSIAKWSGLLRDPQGIAMAAVTLSENAKPARMFLASGVWQNSPAGAAVQFVWHADGAEAARAAANAGLPGIESARWGVIDRGAVNWFNSFTPGAGAFLSSGEEITLVAFDESRPAVAVEIKRDGDTDIFWIEANDSIEGVPVLFEYPAQAPRVYTIHAWQDGSAIVTAYERGGEVARKEMRPRETLSGLRLDDVLASAVPVTEDESTLWAAVVQSQSGEETVLRQGEAKRLEGCLVEYVRRIPPRIVNYTLTVPGKQNVVLKPGQSLRIGPWRLSQAQHDADPGKVAVLNVTYAPLKNLIITFTAIALAALILLLTLQAPHFLRQ